MNEKTIFAEILETEDDSFGLMVGAKKGSKWFYVGTIADMKQNINKYSKKCYKRAIELEENAFGKYEDLLNNEPTLKSFVMQELKNSKPNMTVSNYNAYVNAWLKSVEAKQAAYSKKKKQREEFVPLSERTVLEKFVANGFVEHNIIKIVLTGFETGGYWMSSEAEEIPSISFVDKVEKEEKEQE